MKIAARRRLAVGVVATTSALLAGVLIAPSSTAAPGALRINPNFAVNTETATDLVFEGVDADFRLGGRATFTRIGGGVPFTADIDPDPTAATGVRDTRGEATENFADQGGGLGNDGPSDAGQYDVTATGNDDPLVPGVGGGTDTCTACFTVLSPGPVSVSSVAPNSLRPNNRGNVSILGNNFERGSVVEMLLPGTTTVDTNIRANNPPTSDNTDTGSVVTQGITTRTELRRRVEVLSGATAGVRDVLVRNLDGNASVCTGCFFVAGAALTSVTPTNAAFNDPGQPLTTLTFNGTDVTNGTPRLEFVGDPQNASRGQLTIIGQNVRDATTTSITADFDLSNAAPQDNAYQPQVINSDTGVINACDLCRFSVRQRNERTPTLTSLDRSTEAGNQTDLRQGETATFVATGTNFSEGATLVGLGNGVTVTAVSYGEQDRELLPNQFLVTLSAARDAAPGGRSPMARLTDTKTSNSCSNCLTITSSSATASPTAGATASASPSAGTGTRGDARYDGLDSPQRVLDTRSNRGSRRSGEIILDLSQRITDPNATTAVLNVTVTNPTARGFLVAYPTGTTRPGTSNVNFEAEQRATSTAPANPGTQANEVIVALSSDRRVSLFVDSASAHVIADLVGFFTTTSSPETGRVTTNAPVRALDSRETSNPRRTGEVVLDLSGRLPSGATDAILNVTVQGPDGRGFVTVFPTGTTRPGTSNVNFQRGQTQANEVITRLGTGSNAGRVSLFIDSASTALIVDVIGSVTSGTTTGSQVYTALQQPTRAIDTRDNRGSRRSGAFDVTMPSSVPNNATGVVLNVTATNGTRSGFVTVFPAGTTNPGTSNVNFPGERRATRDRPASAGTQANEVITRLSSDRRVTVFVGGRDGVASHVLVDVVGFLTESRGSAGPSASASPSCTPSLLRSCPTGSASPTASPTTATTASPTAVATVSPTATATP